MIPRKFHTLLTISLLILSTCLCAQHDHEHSLDMHDDEDLDPEEVELDPTQLTGVRLYDWLGYEGYYTDLYSNEELQNFVAEGLDSDSPDIVNATIGSLAWYAVHTLTLKDESGKPRFDRGLSAVPRLKQKLIEVWHANKTAETYPLTTEDVENSIVSSRGRPVIALKYVWSYIPPTLAALFPKDAEVLSVLWDGYDPNNPTSMLDWLNRGQFTTAKATELRLDALESQQESTAVLAAVGLALTNTEDALNALVNRLQIDPGDQVVRAFLIDSIAQFGLRAVPHLKLLRKAAQGADLLPPEGSSLVRPEGYGISTQIGIEYRTQEALRALEELRDSPAQED